jgi:membrane protein DedA with SNARE-associated domain
MAEFIHGEVPQLVALYGYWVVAAIVALESIGLPVPGETTLIAAAIYAGTTHRLSIALVILAAIIGAVAGDSIGFWIGRVVGFRLVLRYGPYVHLTERRLKLGQYVFWRYGGKFVFFGRFVAVLRTAAALLAGVNRMAWPRFLVFNASGGTIWAILYGSAAYAAGDRIRQLSVPIGIAALSAALIAVVIGFILLRRNEDWLANEAERRFPGPIRQRH